MKKILLFLMLALFCIPWAANAQTTITLNGNLTQTLALGTTYYFYDSGGESDDYSTSETYTATFTFSGTITINFSQFATESSSSCYNWDYMLIYDGDAATGTLLARGQTGCSSATLTTGTNFVAESGTMTVEWHSDGSNTAAGWVATITCEEVNCPSPTNITVSNVTANTATLNWECNTDYPFDLEYGTDNTFTTTTGVEDIEETSYALSGLSPNTTYYVRVQTDCDMDVSYWSIKSFTTANPCAAPTGFTASNITASSATVSWTKGYQETAWTVKYKKSSENSWDNATAVAVSGTPTTSLTGLDGLTTYDVRVYNCTGENDPYLTGNFTTAASFPYSQDFSGSTSIPTGWTKYTGLLSAVMNGTALTNGGNWYFGTSNGVFDSHARLNIYGSSCKYWLVTPAIPVASGARLTFDVAYTAYSGTAANPATTGTDDKFVVLASTDNMATWTILRQWDNAGSEYVLNDLTPATLHQVFDLADYAGQDVIVAFYGESTESNADNNIHVDNVVFELVPTCEKPTGLAVSNITAHGATLTWNAEEGATFQYGYEANPAPDFDPANEVPAFWDETTDNTLTWTSGFAAETPHTFYLRKSCGTNGFSEIVSVSFTTGIACPAPTGLAASDITGHTATLNWNGTSDSYNVMYRTAAYAEGIYEGFGTSIPSGWEMYTGLLTDGTATMTAATYGWAFGSNNGVFDDHARVNIYSNYQRWLVTPAFTVSQDASTLSFDLALTAYSGTVSAPAATGTDDKFIVLISTDNMVSWTTLREWNNAGSEYVYNDIANTATGEPVSIDLGSYVGQNVRIAFYGESTVSNADNNLHIDNVHCGILHEAGEWQTVNANASPATITGLDPETDYEAKVQGDCGEEDGVSLETSIISFTTDVACPAPTNVVISDITTTTAKIEWLDHSGADTWWIAYDPNDENAHFIATSNPYTLTDLTPGSIYPIRVAAACGGSDGVSEWSPVVYLTTLPLCLVPTNLDTANVTAHTADMSWTGNGDSYKVYLGTPVIYFSTDFANGIPSEMTNGATYPWSLNDGYIKSSNAGVGSSTSEISLTLNYPEGGVIEFDAECKGEGSSTIFDKCIFSIDNVAQFTYGANVSGWNHYSYNVAAGQHTFSWKYTKDSSVNPTGDYFAVDNIVAQSGDIVWADPITAESEEYAFAGLEGGSTYFVQVQSVCGEDESGLSEVFSFTTPISCYAPTEATVTYTEGLTAEVSWTSDAESFNIDLNGTIIENVTTNPYTLENLAYGTDYTVKVQAVCGAGDVSQWATAGSFTTEEFCPAPTDFTYTTHADGVTVNWNGTSDSYYVKLGVDNGEDLITVDFEDQIIPEMCVNSSTNPWVIAPGHGGYYIKSGNAGVSSSTSTISISSVFPNDGVIEFDAECKGEGTSTIYDKCIFSIDNVAQFTYGANVSDWNHYKFNITAGEHTLSWSYTKDYSVDPDGDYFAVDNVTYHVLSFVWEEPIPSSDTTIDIELLEAKTYAVTVQGVCDGETGAWSNPLTFDFAPVNCEAGIVLNEANPTWKENFDGITTITAPVVVEVQPSCWTWNRTTDLPEGYVDTLPHLYYNSSYAHSGSYSLRLWNRGVYAMPVLDENVNIKQVKMSFYSRHSYSFLNAM